jgi:hypothetical protein
LLFNGAQTIMNLVHCHQVRLKSEIRIPKWCRRINYSGISTDIIKSVKGEAIEVIYDAKFISKEYQKTWDKIQFSDTILEYSSTISVQELRLPAYQLLWRMGFWVALSKPHINSYP